MEIQSFILCKTLEKSGKGNQWDAQHICIHSFYSLDGRYPLKFKMPYYVLLRREQRMSDTRFSIRFNLVNEDGKKIGQPYNFVAAGVFPNGFRFMSLEGTIEFEFPKIGDYRLDITSDENIFPTKYHYNIEVTEKP